MIFDAVVYTKYITLILIVLIFQTSCTFYSVQAFDAIYKLIFILYLLDVV